MHVERLEDRLTPSTVDVLSALYNTPQLAAVVGQSQAAALSRAAAINVVSGYVANPQPPPPLPQADQALIIRMWGQPGDDIIRALQQQDPSLFP